MTQEFQFDGK